MTTKEPLQTKHTDPGAQKRHEAINMYIAGVSPTQICRQLGRSRTWFYTTLKRYQREGRIGLQSCSRAPHRVHNQTPEATEAAIERIRKAITSGTDPELRYANIGADTIAAELQRAKINPPSRATINRILRRRGLASARPKRKQQCQLPKDYPWPQVQQPNQVHLFDFVSRRLGGGERIVGYHLLDQARRWPYLAAQANKTKVLVSQFLVDAWQTIGLPQALYLDNDVVWRGSSSASRTFSHIVRLCLYLGITVIFIPPYTPEANPIIESFNHVWSRNFWQRETFTDLDNVQTKLPDFQHYCRTRRVLPEFDRLTANQLFPDFEPVLLDLDFVLPKRFPLTAGEIHFIRFVSHKGCFSLLNESWQLEADEWAGKVIRAVIVLAEQQLQVYHQKTRHDPLTRIAQFDFEITVPVQPLAQRFARPTVPLWSVAQDQDIPT
jgi:transposase InsO family protein